MNQLLLHTPDSESQLSQYYERAFKRSVELFVVTAYLTAWDESWTPNRNCITFKLIIGKDFGITRKAACDAVMRCLPPERKGDFMVADRIHGFHPKAVIWKEDDEQFFAVVGSSNQTEAAFESNYEANVFCSLSQADYLAAKKWVRQIEQDSVGVSEDWLKKYKEAPLGGGRFLKGSKKNELSNAPVGAFPLPHPRNIGQLIRDRRAQLEAYKENQEGLVGLFHRCADGKITSPQFYEKLPDYWGYEGDRLTGKGFEISAKHSDFQALSLSFVKIIHAADEDRDDVVREEIDRLHDLGVPQGRLFPR